MKYLKYSILFLFIAGCTQNSSISINTITEVLTQSINIYQTIPTISRTRFPTRTKVPTHTVTLTPNNSKIEHLGSISKYILTNKDDLLNNPFSSWAFQYIDVNKQLISQPNIVDFCQIDCVSITWDNRITITLYLLWNKNNSNKYLNLLQDKLYEIYPSMELTSGEIVNEYINSILPEYQGWASVVYLQQYWYTQYFATYYGPIIILISRTTGCVDGCSPEYPVPQIYLARMQLEKIFTLTRQ